MSRKIHNLRFQYINVQFISDFYLFPSPSIFPERPYTDPRDNFMRQRKHILYLAFAKVLCDVSEIIFLQTELALFSAEFQFHKDTTFGNLMTIFYYVYVYFYTFFIKRCFNKNIMFMYIIQFQLTNFKLFYYYYFDHKLLLINTLASFQIPNGLTDLQGRYVHFLKMTIYFFNNRFINTISVIFKNNTK